MTIKQFPKRPFHELPDPLQSLKWLFVIDVESSVDAGYHATCVIVVEKSATQFRVRHVSDRGNFHNCFCMLLGKT